MLATVASIVSMVISVNLESAGRWHPASPFAHPVVATAVASIVFWVTWPRPTLVKLGVFMLMAFATITVVWMLVTTVSLMPS